MKKKLLLMKQSQVIPLLHIDPNLLLTSLLDFLDWNFILNEVNMESVGDYFNQELILAKRRLSANEYISVDNFESVFSQRRHYDFEKLSYEIPDEFSSHHKIDSNE